MEVLMGECGFCKGVSGALELAKKTREEVQHDIFTFGNIIHNKQVVEKLATRGIIPVHSADELKSGDTVVIRAHGAKQSTLKELTDKGVNVVDATCPYIKTIHEKVAGYAREGYGIIIIGDKTHVEVIGTADRCGENVQIVDSDAEVDISVLDKYLVVSQTTCGLAKYEEIKNYIQNLAKTNKKTVEFFNSICYTTIKRQREAEYIARNTDFVAVVGDKTSANTQKLLGLAKAFSPDSVLIENVDDLKSLQIHKLIKKSGILSGASTPKELIMEVFKVMSEELNNGIVAENETVANEEVVAEAAAPVAETNEAAPVAETAEVAEAKEAPAEEPKKDTVYTMADALKKFAPRPYREGLKLKATVVSADLSGITVSVNTGKNDSGFIDRSEAELDGSYDPANYKPNDELDVIIIPKDAGDKNKSINLSKKAYDSIKVDDEKVKGILAGDEFTLACTQEIKGGLLGKIGSYTVFVPASQIRMGYVQNLADYLNKPLRLKALPPKEDKEEDEQKKLRNSKRIVASQRVILEAEKAQREEDFWSSIPVGTIVHGKVKRFAQFGAFVSLKFMDALVHTSELSWARKNIQPEEILALNKSYDFVVLSSDRETGRISLGYKQLQPKPYEIAAEKYPVGTVLKAKVVRVKDFGAFVELEPGIDGLVHASQIAHEYVKNANDKLKVGDEVDVKVMKIEGEHITLSIKELLSAGEPVVSEKTEAAEEGAVEKFDRHNGRVRKDKVTDEEAEGPKEYISSAKVATLADLFKGFKADDAE